MIQHLFKTTFQKDSKQTHFPEYLLVVTTCIVLNGPRHATTPVCSFETGWGVLLRQDGYEGTATNQFHECYTPASIMNTNKTEGVIIFVRVDIETCLCVNDSLRPVKTHFHLESSLPHTPLHSTHVYCVNKRTKGSSRLGVVDARHQAVSLERWQALSHRLSLWFQPDGYLHMSSIM